MSFKFIKTSSASPLSYAKGFVFKDDNLTIRIFRPIPLTAENAKSLPPTLFATDDDIKNATENVGVPMTSKYGMQTLYYPSSMFTGFKGDVDNIKFVPMGELTWALNEKYLGKYAVSDRISWAFTIIPNVGMSFMNRTAYRMEYRTPLEYINFTENMESLASIGQRYKDTPLSDCLILLNVDDQNGYYHNLTDVVEVDAKNMNLVDGYYANIAIDDSVPIKSGAEATVNVRVMLDGKIDTNANCTLYLNEVVGYAPKKQIEIVKGVGSFKVVARYLDSGDTIKIGVGWKNWLNEVYYFAPVTSA